MIISQTISHGAQPEEHAAIASLNRMDAEMNVWLGAARAKRMHNEPTAPARKEETAA